MLRTRVKYPSAVGRNPSQWISAQKKKKKEDLPPRIKYATNSWVFEKPTTPKASPVAWDAKRIVIWKRMMVKREPNVKCLVAYP